MPTALWTRFRSLPSLGDSDIDAANKVANTAGLSFAHLPKISDIAMQTTMNKEELAVLQGIANREMAEYYLSQIDVLVTKYVKGWQIAGLILPII